MKRIYAMLLCAVLATSLVLPAYASETPSEIEAAGAALRERGIYQGDESGNLQLGRGLNRAELATILARLDGGVDEDLDWYDWACYFTDVPGWAKGCVGYCVMGGLLKRYGDQRFGAFDPVTPNVASTVVLRACGYGSGEEVNWDYKTAASYAVSQGLLSQSTAQAAVITRGELAVLIHRALEKEENGTNIHVPAPKPGEYRISADHWSREDFSRQANPAVFTGIYDRALYNTIRQTIVDRGTENSAGNRCAYTMVSKDNYSKVMQMIGRIDGLLWYEHYVPDNFANYYEYLDYFAVSARMPEQYQAPLEFVRPVLEKVEKMDTDREKVTYLNDYLRSLMTYDRGSVTGITRTFAPHSEELKGACGDYAHNFKFLCEAAGIPCFSILTEDHAWNLVYAEGQWLHVDVSANDVYNSNSILLVKTYHSEKDDIAPEATAFLKELLVPGSTK